MQVGYMKQITIFDQYLASSRVVNAATVRFYQHGAVGRKLVTLIPDGSNRRSLLMAEDGRRSVYTSTLYRRKQNCIYAGAVLEVGRYGRLKTISPLLSDDCYTQKQFCCHQTGFLGSKYHTNAFATASGAMFWTPLRELTALPHTLVGRKGWMEGKKNGE